MHFKSCGEERPGEHYGSAIYNSQQPQYAMLAVLEIIGRRQDKERPSWAQRQKRKAI